MLPLTLTEQRQGLKESMKGGGTTKRAPSYIYHPINLHGGEIRFLNFEHLNPMGELWQIQT